MPTYRLNVPRRAALTVMAGLVGVLLATSLAASSSTPSAPHPEAGPHGGPLLELGDEEFHLEVVLDEKQKLITLYVLDKSGRVAVPIDAPEILVNLKHSGKPVQYRLKAIAETGETASGPSASFQLKSGSLVHALEHNDHGARVSARIRNRAYNVRLNLDLSHGHDHQH